MTKTTGSKITSEQIHKINCWRYLRSLNVGAVKVDDKIIISTLILYNFPDEIREQLKKVWAETTFDEKTNYAQLYTSFVAFVDNNIELFDTKSTEREDEIQILDEFISSVYKNESGILEATFENIKDLPTNHKPTSSKLEKKISSYVADGSFSRAHRLTLAPTDIGSIYLRMDAMLSPEFKPQYTTSLPTIRSKSEKRIEYRFGTQGQRDDGNVQVSPLFKRWIETQADVDNPDKITHIYFNNLARNRDNNDYEGNLEVDLTYALHELEEKHSNIAVITLPADKGFMDAHDYTKTEEVLNGKEVFEEFVNIPLLNLGKNDFYISHKIESLLYSDNDKKEKKIRQLLTNSFTKFNIDKNKKISHSDRQAIWFDFIKFEFTNFVIETLDPKGFNITCKDGIDRAAAASVYYNLMKSIETDNPLTREEFERGLHAAATMVKGRGMNHHINLVWNAVNAYVNCHYDAIKNNENLKWLIEWRNANFPHARIRQDLSLRINLSNAELVEIKEPKYEEAVKAGKAILGYLGELNNAGVSGKRLMFEIARLTPLIIQNRNPDDLKYYAKLANTAKINYPKMQFLFANFMKALSHVLHYTSFTKLSFIDSWSSTVEASRSVNVKKRNDMLELMKKIGEPIKVSDEIDCSDHEQDTYPLTQ